ncbi:MAG: hypothetical protein JO111_01990 [Caulobacteraceae bacterium]|nr:hypothetical protein [Caulobacteraceae bacterium]
MTAPAVEVGDSWTFDRTIERGTEHLSHRRITLRIERIDETAMLVRAQPGRAPEAYEDYRVGLDWSQARVLDGVLTETGRPFKFPMVPGDSWTVDFSQAEQHEGQTNTHWNVTYEVVGWTVVTTPAGTFRALEIKEAGSIEAERAAPQVRATTLLATTKRKIKSSGKNDVRHQSIHNMVYGEFYYVPSIKYYVKSFEEQYNADNVRTGWDEDALVAFRPGVLATPHR